MGKVKWGEILDKQSVREEEGLKSARDHAQKKELKSMEIEGRKDLYGTYDKRRADTKADEKEKQKREDDDAAADIMVGSLEKQIMAQYGANVASEGFSISAFEKFTGQKPSKDKTIYAPGKEDVPISDAFNGLYQSALEVKQKTGVDIDPKAIIRSLARKYRKNDELVAEFNNWIAKEEFKAIRDVGVYGAKKEIDKKYKDPVPPGGKYPKPRDMADAFRIFTHFNPDLVVEVLDDDGNVVALRPKKWTPEQEKRAAAFFKKLGFDISDAFPSEAERKAAEAEADKPENLLPKPQEQGMLDSLIGGVKKMTSGWGGPPAAPQQVAPPQQAIQPQPSPVGRGPAPQQPMSPGGKNPLELDPRLLGMQ